MIARAAGGGGHKAAAGFSTEMARRRAQRLPARPGRRAALAWPARQPTADGLVLADKPAGKTSHDLTTFVRRELGVRSAGHAGTLDPFATGLMLVLVGRARRVQRFFTALPKEYEAIARFGAVSTTGDPDGEITQHGRRVPAGALGCRPGAIRQRPPAYSAVHVDGRRAYERARAGRTVELPEREVTSTRSSSSGARTTAPGCASSARRAPTCAASSPTSATPTREELRRTRIGPFDVADADPERVIPLADALGLFRTRALTPRPRAARATASRCAARGGVAEPDGRGRCRAPDEVLLLDADGPIALARAARDGAAQALRRLPGVKVTPLPRRRAASAPRRGRHLRRRPPRATAR